MKKLTLIISLLMIPFLLFAAFGKYGTTSVQFLKMGVGARGIALGDAYIALANDASATYWNPAGITAVENQDAMASYTKWFADINHTYMAYVKNMGMMGSVGVSFSALTMDEMDEIKEYVGPTGRKFRAGDYSFALSYARAMTDRFSFGGTLKGYYEFLFNDEVDHFGWAVDLGTQYDIGYKGMTLAMAVRNFGPNVRYTQDNDKDGQEDEDKYNLIDDDGDGLVDEDPEEQDAPIPLVFSIGLSMEAYKDDVHAVVVASQIDHAIDEEENYALGVEYGYSDMFFARTGYRFNTDEEGLTLGAGVKMPMGINQVKVDFSWSEFGNLMDGMGDAPMRLTVGYSF